MNGGAGVLIDELFEFDAMLEPILSADEILDLPPGEQRGLGTEDSALRTAAIMSFPVRFLIP